MITLTPSAGQPSIRIKTMICGKPYVSNLAFAETFVINGTPCHLSSANPDGTPHFEGVGEWSSDGNVHSYSCELTTFPQLKYDFLIAVRGKYLEMDLSVQNLSGVAWDDKSDVICCFPQKLNPDFLDTIGTYTFAPHDGDDGCRMATISSLVAQPIDQWALYYQNPLAPPIQRCCGTMVARMSQDQQHFVGISFLKTPMLSGNMGGDFQCIHANPSVGPLAAGEKMSNRGRICLDEPTLTSFSINAPII